MTDTPDETEILARYSTPGLRRNVLTRWEKKFQLDGIGITGRRAEEILEQLYPQETESCPSIDPPA